MTLITRFPVSPPSTATARPVLAWASGLTPNRRWTPGKLPAAGSTLTSWTSSLGDSTKLTMYGSNTAAVEEESGIKYVALPGGATGVGLDLTGIDAATMRTVVVIARPNTGDIGSGNIITAFNANGFIQQVKNQDTATPNADAAYGLTAPRNRWHVYSLSLPAVGSSDTTAVFAVDGQAQTIPYTESAWNMSRLKIAFSGSTDGRQLKVLEVLTSAGTFDATTMTGLHAKAKSWYSPLTW